MKSIVTKSILFLFISAVLTSCNIGMLNGVKGNGNVITKNRKVSEDFKTIKVSTGWDVYITQGDKNEVGVEADENLHDIIITNIENGALKIYSDKGIWGATANKIHVTVKDLQTLAATSGSNVFSENEISTSNFSVSVTSGADVNVKVNAENVQTNATSGADLRISGKSINHTSKATSGASINAYDLISENVNAGATSGADINVYASEKINASATSAGDIDYKGNPKTTKKSSTSGGSVSQK